MPTLLEIAPFVALALAGSLHCAGMCGPFAIVASARGPWTGSLAYVVGKAFTYSLLGVLAASAGSTLLEGGESLRALLAWFIGLMFVASGCTAIGWIRPRRVLASALPIPFRRSFSAVQRLPGVAASFGTGMLTGLLPCGLSWSALLLAAQSRPGAALLGSFCFGLATGPGLIAIAGGWRLTPASWRTRGRYALGIVLLMFGALTIARSIDRECCTGEPTRETATLEE